MRTLRITVLIGIVCATGVIASARTTRPSQPENVQAALLVEVRGLRAAMEQMASAAPRVQLALGRLQLQEQRVNTMLRRLEAVRDSLATAQGAVVEHQTQIARLEAALRTGTAPPEVREQFTHQIAAHRDELARPLAEVQRLTAEEASLVSDIAGEQTRWSDFNQRLDELERALTRR